MRKVLDGCSIPGCGGVLVITRESRNSGGGLIGGAPVQTRYTLRGLYCNTCGVCYKPEHEGKDLQALRAAAWGSNPAREIPAVPSRCEACKGIVLEAEPITLLGATRREERRGVFCVQCNTPIGLLPKDGGG